MWIYTLQAESSSDLDPHLVCDWGQGFGSVHQSSWPGRMLRTKPASEVLPGFVSDMLMTYQRELLSSLLFYQDLRSRKLGLRTQTQRRVLLWVSWATVGDSEHILSPWHIWTNENHVAFQKNKLKLAQITCRIATEGKYAPDHWHP